MQQLVSLEQQQKELFFEEQRRMERYEAGISGYIKMSKDVRAGLKIPRQHRKSFQFNPNYVSETFAIVELRRPLNIGSLSRKPCP